MSSNKINSKAGSASAASAPACTKDWADHVNTVFFFPKPGELKQIEWVGKNGKPCKCMLFTIEGITAEGRTVKVLCWGDERAEKVHFFFKEILEVHNCKLLAFPSAEGVPDTAFWFREQACTGGDVGQYAFILNLKSVVKEAGVKVRLGMKAMPLPFHWDDNCAYTLHGNKLQAPSCWSFQQDVESDEDEFTLANISAIKLISFEDASPKKKRRL